jgi:SPP1 family predicted phage head-tail adaptor
MIGEMRHRVAVQTATATNNLGVITETWATIETVYASVRTLTGREAEDASKPEAIYTHEFTMRYRDDLGTADTQMLNKYRLVFRSENHDVRSVENVDFRDKFMIVKTERQG